MSKLPSDIASSPTTHHTACDNPIKTEEISGKLLSKLFRAPIDESARAVVKTMNLDGISLDETAKLTFKSVNLDCLPIPKTPALSEDKKPFLDR